VTVLDRWGSGVAQPSTSQRRPLSARTSTSTYVVCAAYLHHKLDTQNPRCFARCIVKPPLSHSQALPNSLQVPARHGASVLGRTVQARFWHTGSPSSPICYTWSARQASIRAGDIRQTGFFICRPGPSAWNSLPAHLRSQNVTINNFRHSLKTFLFSQMIHAAH